MMTVWKTLLSLVLLGGQRMLLVRGQICFMVYQMADNDLEAFIRADLTEITNSPAVQDAANMVTWVYFDARNFGSATADGTPEIVDPIDNVFNADGSPLTQKYEGSRYLTWDANLQRMVVDTELSEQDSDLGTTVQAFLQYALADCIAQGTTEYMLVFSSHGGGYAGFGADDNEPARRWLAAQGELQKEEEMPVLPPMSFHRWLGYQSNLSIRAAILNALSSTPGAPAVLDVLGFDACLMQSVGALDEFKDVTRYFLASEAVEPGHGWAYDEVTVNTNVLAFATDIQVKFLTSLHLPVYGFHATPKTLAVTDTSRFDPFIAAWEAMVAEFTTILLAQNDPDFFGNLHRARGAAVSYSGSLDQPEDKVKAAMDIGSFLQTFIDFCQPDPNSSFGILVNNALTTYDAMFVATGNGPGSPAGTGMHISWVSKEVYNSFTAYYDGILFGTSPPIQDVPNYYTFLQTYYASTTPTTNAGSVCGVDLEPDRPPADDELLIDPELIFPDDGSTEVQSQLARSVDFVFFEYGIDITNILDELDEGNRRLRDALRQWEDRRRALAQNDKTDTNTSAENSLRRRRRLSRPTRRSPRRNLQGNFFDLFGGDVIPEYDGASIRANWDGFFFWIEYEKDGETLFDPVYVFDDGNGAKSIPVCYFNPANPITADDIPFGTQTTDVGFDALGCLDGYLTFNSDSSGAISFSLFAFQDQQGGTSLSEIPRSAGGQIVPVLYFDLQYNALSLTESVGGTNQVILSWDTDETFSVVRVNEVQMLSIYSSDTVFVELFAFDDDTDLVDSIRYPYTILVEDDSPTASPTSPPPTTSPPTSYAHSRLATYTTGLLLAGLVLLAAAWMA